MSLGGQIVVEDINDLQHCSCKELAFHNPWLQHSIKSTVHLKFSINLVDKYNDKETRTFIGSNFLQSSLFKHHAARLHAIFMDQYHQHKS